MCEKDHVAHEAALKLGDSVYEEVTDLVQPLKGNTGVQSFFQQNLTDWSGVMALAVVMMLPPIIVFATLNKYFSVGGIGGSLAGR